MKHLLADRKFQLIGCRAAKTGFALLEMIGVLAVIAILAGAMAPFLLNQIDRTEGDAEQAALEAIAEGVRQYFLDDSVATYGTLPANLTILSGGYVSAGAVDIVTNDRGVTRLYQNNGATLATIPRVTIASHLLVGGDAPTNMAACVGSALAAIDPCGDSPGTTTDDMPAGVATNLIKVANLNLAKERAAIVDHIKGYYLAPVVSAIEGLSNDVCQSIADGTSDIDGNDASGNAIPAALVNSAPGVGTALEGEDHWGNKLQLTKTGNRVDVWSSGPVAMAAVPTNPLYLTATCAPGSDVTEQLKEIADAVIGYMGDQYSVAAPTPISLPGGLGDVGLSNADITDPWGNLINSDFTTASGGFTLTSLGPDGAAGGGDDVQLTKSFEELVGLFAAMGWGYDTAPPASPSPGNYADCAAVDGWMTGAGGCDTALGYLINASECNVAITYDQECAVKGY